MDNSTWPTILQDSIVGNKACIDFPMMRADKTATLNPFAMLSNS